MADPRSWSAAKALGRSPKKPPALPSKGGRGSRGGRRLHHRVYVVLLDPAILRRWRFRRDNPGYKPGMPCVYVGATGLTPEKRFENHRAGHKASKWVAGFGVRLLPELYAHLPAMTYAEASKKEERLARELRLAGYAVAQN